MFEDQDLREQLSPRSWSSSDMLYGKLSSMARQNMCVCRVSVIELREAIGGRSFPREERRPCYAAGFSGPREVKGDWCPPRSSKPVRRAIPGGRVRFPSASAQGFRDLARAASDEDLSPNCRRLVMQGHPLITLMSPCPSERRPITALMTPRSSSAAINPSVFPGSTAMRRPPEVWAS